MRKALVNSSIGLKIPYFFNRLPSQCTYFLPHHYVQLFPGKSHLSFLKHQYIIVPKVGNVSLFKIIGPQFPRTSKVIKIKMLKSLIIITPLIAPLLPHQGISSLFHDKRYQNHPPRCNQQKNCWWPLNSVTVNSILSPMVLVQWLCVAILASK